MAMNENSAGPQARAGKKRIPRILPILAVLAIIIGLQAATQYYAHIVNYDNLLGFNINNVYPFWSIITWSFSWYSDDNSSFMSAYNVGAVACGVGFLLIAVIKTMLVNTSKANEYLHGSARWAKKEDIQGAGLLPPTPTLKNRLFGNVSSEWPGVFVGAWEDPKTGEYKYLKHDGPEHVLTYAPTRSGKGVGLVIPTLLSWPHSAVIADLKGELWALTSGWRQKYAKNLVLCFEPSSPGSIKWNPIDEIALDTDGDVRDAQNLARLIVDPDGKGLNSHWEKVADVLLTGVILHAAYKAKKENKKVGLADLDMILADPSRPVSELWEEMILYKHKRVPNTEPPQYENHPVVAQAGVDMRDRPEEERGSVLSTVKSYLTLYRDPIVAENTRECEFKVNDIMNSEKAVSLYIITQPTDKDRLRPLIRILLNTIIKKLADKDKMSFEGGRAKGVYKHKMLLMLDEFPALGKLDILQESLAFLAGYGIKAYLITQDLNQLKSRETGYGPDETITSNCHVQNAYPPNRIETAEHLSRLTGQTTIVKKQVTMSGRRASAIMGNVSTTLQEVQRPLLTPDECLRMPGPKKDGAQIVEAGDMVIYVAGYPAIYGRQPLYFKEPAFVKRASIPAPKGDIIRKSKGASINATND